MARADDVACRTADHRSSSSELTAPARASPVYGADSLENDAARALLVPLRAAEQSCPGGILEHLADTLASLSRALQVVLSTNLLCDGHALSEKGKVM